MMNKIKNSEKIKKIIFIFYMLCFLVGKSFSQTKNISFNPNGTKILLYSEANYKGKQLMLDGEGQYDFAAVTKSWNNNISSMQVPKGYNVILFDIRHIAGDDLPLAAELLTSTTKPLMIPNLKKFTCSYQSPKQSDADFGKKMTVNFDKMTSYVEIVKM